VLLEYVDYLETVLQLDSPMLIQQEHSATKRNLSK